MEDSGRAAELPDGRLLVPEDDFTEDDFAEDDDLQGPPTEPPPNDSPKPRARL